MNFRDKVLQVGAFLSDRYGRQEMRRVAQAVDELAGGPAHPRAEFQSPEQLFLPGLPPTPWYEAADFEFCRKLEAGSVTIRNELIQLIESDAAFTPYIEKGNLEQRSKKFAEVAHSWTTFGFGDPQNRARCPQTTRLFTELLRPNLGEPMAAVFSVLAPGAHIPPHCGSSNTKLTTHLGLIVPTNCRMRVGATTRSWSEGRCLLFDDSFEHEVWHDGDAPRYILLFQVWHPDLSEPEILALKILSDWLASEAPQPP